MSDYTFFFNPMSRAMIANWAFHEVGVTPDYVQVEWDAKPAELLAANPMGKIPTIIHHTPAGDRVVSEAAAVCHYLAEMEGKALLPTPGEKADYYRWLFFAAGPLEAAITNKTMGWEPDGPKQEGTVGFGSFERAVGALDTWLADRHYVCGDRFTMADVYVGSSVNWGLQFGTLPDRDSFKAYSARVSDRDAFRASIGG
ncbi:glutathione binding-like protein [Aurantiacibacter sp. MUD11]|uniref:glutathione S-transferase family protein n=1 Tax=Aurantiacibacter sp. MUD11 TaxID=3003265 RepID=UPI0022AA5650|nr:glutathione binding-like protein [Aurantiacibacter sp. MUD11]WAT18826.1 glutathione binding-like protein [Aurantiacibacter sp. MUD11]